MENIDLLKEFKIVLEKYKDDNKLIKVIIDKDIITNKTISHTNRFTDDQFLTMINNEKYINFILQDFFIDLIKTLTKNNNLIFIKSIILYDATKKIICEYFEEQINIICKWE